MASRGGHLPRRRVRSSRARDSITRDRRNGVTYRIITDNQGSVRLVVNAETGDVAQRLDYDSFGRVLRDTNPGFQPFGFQGGLYDPDTGLVEFGCRWYDAETGRWISKDPILLDGGWNVYAFCDNDPVNRTDPSGMCESVTWAWVKGFGQGFWEAYADGSCISGIEAWNAGLLYGPFGDGSYDPDYEVSYWGGVITKGAILGAVFGPGGYNLSGSTQMITRWSTTRSIGSGSWVMLGPPSLLNLIKTTKWQLWWGVINGTVKPLTMDVPKSSLAWPSESGIIGGAMRFIQGLFGQRIYNGE